MTLPEPRRVVLPVPPTGAADARRAGGRRRARSLAGAAAVLVVATAAAALLPGSQAVDRLQVAIGVDRPEEQGLPGRLSGRVTDVSGRPLARVAVLPADLSAVLDRTDAQGRYDVPCGSALVVASYAPTRPGGPVFERAPGAGDLAWRRVPDRCGERLDVVLPTSGTVTGVAAPGEDVRLERVRAGTDEVAPEGPVFAGRADATGAFSVNGLDTGRYRVVGASREPVFVDVVEGRIVRLP